MTNSSRPSISGRDVAGAGALMLSVNLLCAAIGYGIGAIFGAAVALAIIGFLIGFLLGIWYVIERFKDI
jgi:putative Mn2+ efflux pump MntP